MAAPAFPSKADLEAELAAEQAAAAAAAVGNTAAAAAAGGGGGGCAATNGNSIPRATSSSPLNRVNGKPAGLSNTSASASHSDDSGPTELTLIAYSAFMGLSSLVFGGLTLLQARSSTTADSHSASEPSSVKQMLAQRLTIAMSAVYTQLGWLAALDTQTLVTGLLVVSIIFTIAFTTKPSDESFRSYLTDLSIHDHLRRIQDHKDDVPDAAAEIDDTSSHVLTFANRISLSLRTPPYVRHDYALFSIVMVPHPATASPTPRRARTSWFIGVFGKWWHGAREWEDGDVNLQHDDKELGVLGMTADGEELEGSGTEDASDGPAGDSNASPAAAPSIAAPKSTRRKRNALRLRGTALPPLRAIAAQREKAASEDAKVEDAGAAPSPSSTHSIITSEAQDSSSNAAATAAAMASVKAVIADLQSQLSSLQQGSDATRQQLQFQLEELRTRKKDDDTQRADLKNRMKSLDEGKRLAEGARRDAEKRLKTAQTTRESHQKRSQDARANLVSFKERETASIQRTKDVLALGKTRREEIKTELGEKEEAIQQADEALAGLRKRIEALEQQVVSDQDRLRGAQESAQARAYYKAQQANAAAAAASQAQFQQRQQQQHFQQMPAGGEGGAGWLGPVDHDRYDFYDGRDYYDGYDGGQYGQEPMYGSGPDAGFRQESEGYRPYSAPKSRRPSMDPTLASGQFEDSSGARNRGPFQPFTPSDSTSASFVHTPRQQRSLESLSNGGARKASLGPNSPFSTDLLPSNLFQSVDDDGVLNSRSDRIEAALNQFGLDNSDQSDAEQSDRDTADGVLEGHLQPLSEHESDSGEPIGSGRTGPKPAARSWWRVKRERSASRGASDRVDDNAESDPAGARAGSEDALSSSASSGGKRRSLGAFSKLGFRSVSGRKQPAPPSSGVMRSSSGRGVSTPPAGTPFDVVMRAFEANNPPDEEEGRRSWSAFDQWNSQQGRSQHGSAGHGQTTPSNLGKGSFSGWSEDLFQPLDRAPTSASAEANTSSTASTTSSGAPGPQQQQQRRSRFAFWTPGSKGSLQSAGSESTSSDKGLTAMSSSDSADDSLNSNADAGAGGSGNGNGSNAMTSTTPRTSTPGNNGGKKKSFRWPRRQNSSAGRSTASDDLDADAEE